MIRFVLASASPARLRTLRAAGVDPEVIVSHVDESTVGASSPASTCATLARLKAEAVLTRLWRESPGVVGPTLVLGCDSVLEFNGQVLGKPAGAEDATRRWQRMRSASGVLHTGHCLVDGVTGALAEAVAATVVHFADVTDAEIAAYIATREPLEVAGAFTIDGLGGWFVDSIEGDAGNVIGVSLPLLRGLLTKFGVTMDQLWQLSPSQTAPHP